MFKRFKSWLLNQAIKKFIKPLTASDVLHRDSSGQLMFGNKKIERQDEIELANNAARLLHSRLWKLVKTDLEYQAQSKILRTSQNVNDVLASRIMMYTIRELEQVLVKLSQPS